jgi:GNAT superfamily N-acetyltransferase
MPTPFIRGGRAASSRSCLVSAEVASDPTAAGPRELAEGIEIRPARLEEADELLPLMRAYCDFYESSPPDQGVLEMARTLISDPSQGVVFIAREGERAVGFATLDWKWSMLKGAKIGFLEDLYVLEELRGRGIADALIAVCAERCRELGMPAMQWLTQPHNRRAQAVYDRTGAPAETLVEYDLAV